MVHRRNATSGDAHAVATSESAPMQVVLKLSTRSLLSDIAIILYYIVGVKPVEK